MNSTANFTADSTVPSIGFMSGLDLCACCINLLVALPMHLYIIWITITETGISTDLINLNISVCELANCLRSLIDVLSLWFSHLKTPSQSLQGLIITGRPLFQSLICFERYLAVVHPVTFRRFKPLRNRVICCAAAWVFILSSCVFCFFMVTSPNPSPYARMFNVQYLFFTCLQGFLLLSILISLRQPGPGDKGKEKENQLKRKAIKHVQITAWALLLVFAPYRIVAYVFTLYSFPALWLIVIVGYLLDGFLQPFLFLRRTGKLTLSS